MAWHDKANGCWRGIVRPEGRKGKRIMERFDAEHDAIEWEQQMKNLVGQGVHPDMTVKSLRAGSCYTRSKIADRREHSLTMRASSICIFFRHSEIGLCGT